MSNKFTRLFFEVILFAITGLILGIAITFLFPYVTHDEPLWYTFFWLFVQFIVSAIFIYVIDKSYFYAFGIDSDEFIGITIFANILFASQVQIYERINMIYNAIIGIPNTSKVIK